MKSIKALRSVKINYNFVNDELHTIQRQIRKFKHLSFDLYYLPIVDGLLLRFITHKVGRTPLQEGSVRRSGLYTCTTHNEETNIHAHGGIRTRNPSNRATTDLSLDRAATEIGLNTDGIKRCLKQILIFSNYVIILKLHRGLVFRNGNRRTSANRDGKARKLFEQKPMYFPLPQLVEQER